MKHLLALGVCLLAFRSAPLAAQTAAGGGKNLAVVSAGPTGEVASLAEANEIRIVFSEPMVSLGRIPAVVQAPYVRIAPAIPGAFRWSGTTILIFTPAVKPPLPYATRYDVTVDATAAAVSGRTLGKPYTFSFTTPTVKLLRTQTYRRGGRADAPFVVLLRFNQPVEPADVARASERAVRAARLGTAARSRRRPAAAGGDRSDLDDAVQRQGRGDECRGFVEPPGGAAAHERLGQEALSACQHARGVRDRHPRSVRELGEAHARRRAEVARRSGDARPASRNTR